MNIHWRVRIDAPHPMSYLAFMLGMLEQVERTDGPEPALWAGPVDLDHCEPEHRAYWANWNPVLETFENAIRKQIDVDLSPILAKSFSLDHSDVRRIADCMLAGRRAALMAEEQVADARAAPILAKFPIKPASALVFFVKLAFREASPAASENALNRQVAAYLSRGIPRGQTRQYAITRNHVDRACKSFLNALGGQVNSCRSECGQDLVIEAVFFLWQGKLKAVETIGAAAMKQPSLRGKTGADLVEAIERSHGVQPTFYRVLNRQRMAWPA
jgi:hypothetical protein